MSLRRRCRTGYALRVRLAEYFRRAEGFMGLCWSVSTTVQGSGWDPLKGRGGCDSGGRTETQKALWSPLNTLKSSGLGQKPE